MTEAFNTPKAIARFEGIGLMHVLPVKRL